MKIYIAGKITGCADFEKKFKKAEEWLKSNGHTVMNPAILPEGFSQEEYMHICYAMIDVCEAIYMLNNWRSSAGAMLEHVYAVKKNKLIEYQKDESKNTKLKKTDKGGYAYVF